MSIQGQLSRSQEVASTLYFLMFEVPTETGVLGNQSVQAPASAGGPSHLASRAEPPAVAADIAAPESAEMGWLVQNAVELGRHKGEWLLIRGAELLAHSRDFAVVSATIRERQIVSPFVYYVPSDDESNSLTI